MWFTVAQDEKSNQPNKPNTGNLNPYYALVLLVLLVEGLIGYLILDRAIPKPEVAEKEIEIKEDKSWNILPPKTNGQNFKGELKYENP